jgi:hypothetical protein
MNFGVYTKAHYKTSRQKIPSHEAACDMALMLSCMLHRRSASDRVSGPPLPFQPDSLASFKTPSADDQVSPLLLPE